VIPALNEAGVLPVLLDQLRRQQGIRLEVIVADGGSTDATGTAVAAAGARLVAAPRGRGIQMNAGARAATAPILLFLHADSELVATHQLRTALDHLRAERARGGARVAGHFALRFARRRPGHAFFYRYLEEKTALNRAGTINGDQGLMLGADYFGELGGFDESLPFLEDQRLASRIFATGRWVNLPGRLRTSARRFEREGAYRRYTLMSLIMGLHAAGAGEFFRRAPAVYAAQAETGRLRVGTYLALTWRVLLGSGRGAFGILFRAGRYTRQNSWQPFFACDVALRLARNPCLGFHDRIFRRLTDNALFDGLTAVLIAAWFLAVLPLTFLVVDGVRRPEHSKRGPAGLGGPGTSPQGRNK
jgi:rSAM/selenodomain-associated transferase 2